MKICYTTTHATNCIVYPTTRPIFFRVGSSFRAGGCAAQGSCLCAPVVAGPAGMMWVGVAAAAAAAAVGDDSVGCVGLVESEAAPVVAAELNDAAAAAVVVVAAVAAAAAGVGGTVAVIFAVAEAAEVGRHRWDWLSGKLRISDPGPAPCPGWNASLIWSKTWVIDPHCYMGYRPTLLHGCQTHTVTWVSDPHCYMGVRPTLLHGL